MGTRDHDNGSAAAFSVFVAERWEQAVRMTAQRTRDRHDAEDVVAEAMANLWKRWRQTEVGNPWGYLCRSIQNELIDRSRKAAGERKAYERLDVPRPSVDVQPSEHHDTLRRALALLPPASRQVLALRHLLDLSEQEAARRLRLPVGTVKSQAFRGIRRAREMRRAKPAVGVTRPAATHPVIVAAQH